MQSTPRRPRSSASVRPTGPAPTIRTDVSTRHDHVLHGAIRPAARRLSTRERSRSVREPNCRDAASVDADLPSIPCAGPASREELRCRIRLRSRRTFLAAVALSARACSPPAAARPRRQRPRATSGSRRAFAQRRRRPPRPRQRDRGRRRARPPPLRTRAGSRGPANRPAAEADAAARSSGVAATAPPAAAAARQGQPRPPQPAAIQAATASAHPGEAADPAPVVHAQAGRMVIYTTEVSVLVASPSPARQLARRRRDAGRRLRRWRREQGRGRRPRHHHPPEDPARTGTSSAMRQIRGLAVEVTGEKATTQDVTEEFSDVQTQLALARSEPRPASGAAGASAQNVEEILKIQEKLAQTKLQIDRLKGRETFLQRSADLATITINARPAEEVLARTFSTLRTSLRRCRGPACPDADGDPERPDSRGGGDPARPPRRGHPRRSIGSPPASRTSRPRRRPPSITLPTPAAGRPRLRGDHGPGAGQGVPAAGRRAPRRRSRARPPNPRTAPEPTALS